VRTQVSIEFFPPKDAQGEERLWSALTQLSDIAPDFVSVTYGAGGSTRDRTLRITSEITERTGIPTVAHLTCVGASRQELMSVLTQYKSAGISRVLALRGDPPSGPHGEWISTPEGIDHADELVRIAAEMGFDVGVAAFPNGHPASKDRSEDINTLKRKVNAGARFAISQFFFEVSSWQKFMDEVSSANIDITLIPGIMPVTNVNQIIRFAQLSGTEIPAPIKSAFEKVADDPVAVGKLGVEVATQLCQELLEIGVTSLHFFTLNNSTATRDIVANLGLHR
jgi:methylenetetrahydrofolate reductase (NADPH)